MLQTNHQKLTKEFCRGRRLIFFPQTKEEAALIQRELFGMGFAWSSGLTKITRLADCVNSGMLLTAEGALYHNLSSGDNGLLCAAAQFDENYQPPETLLLLEQFNKLSAQIKNLAREVAEIKEQLQPRKLDKIPQQKPGRGP